MNAIQVETDPQNTHMLLGGLMLCVQDSALFEECAEINVDTRQTSPAPSDTNLLSSGMKNIDEHILNLVGNRLFHIFFFTFVLHSTFKCSFFVYLCVIYCSHFKCSVSNNDADL